MTPTLPRLLASTLAVAALPTLAQNTPNTHDRKWINAYYAQWKVYSQYYAKQLVTSESAGKLNFITYAFADIRADAKGKPRCATFDEYADFQFHFTQETSVNATNDSWATGALSGNFHQLQELKQLYPKMKIILSIGGASAGTGGFEAAAKTENRQVFVQSCIDGFINGNFGATTGLNPIWDPTEKEQAAVTITPVSGIFDGFDIDWEFPTAGEKQAYLDLLQEFRSQLGKKAILTAALPAGEQNFSLFDLAGTAKELTFINLETYDYNGPWQNETGFVAPLYQTEFDPYTNLNVNYTVQAYLSAGVPPEKILLGIPFYGYGWTVNSGAPADRNGQYVSATPFASATLEYNYIATTLLPMYEIFRDRRGETPWLYDSVSTQSFVTYDDAISIDNKMEYVKAKNLRGAFAWELSGDLPDGHLVNTMFWGLNQ